MAGQMGLIVYKDVPSVEHIFKCLMLPTVDDTQTALANEDIHISESTAIKLRENVQLGLIENEIIVISRAPKTRCWDKFKQTFRRLFSITPATPFEKKKEFRALSDIR